MGRRASAVGCGGRRVLAGALSAGVSTHRTGSSRQGQVHGQRKAPPRRSLDFKILVASVVRLLAWDRIFTATEPSPNHSILGLFISRCCKTIENQRALVLEGVLLSLVQIMTLPRLRGGLEAGQNWPQAPGVWSWAPPAATGGPLTHPEP